MYMVKVYDRDILLDVLMYKKFRQAIGELLTKESFIYDQIEDKTFDPMRIEKAFYASEDKKGIADDFEFFFENGIHICISKAICKKDFVYPYGGK